MSGFDFDLKDAEEFPVNIVQKDGSKKSYVIREFDGGARNQYLTNVTKRMKSDGQGGLMLQDFTGLEAALLTKCMFDAVSDKPVTIQEVDSWPAHVVKKVFEKAKEVCKLDDEAEEREKNDS